MIISAIKCMVRSSDGGLTLETLASLSYHGGSLTLIKLECKVATLTGDEFQSSEIACTLLFQGYALCFFKAVPFDD